MRVNISIHAWNVGRNITFFSSNGSLSIASAWFRRLHHHELPGQTISNIVNKEGQTPKVTVEEAAVLSCGYNRQSPPVNRRPCQRGLT